MVYIIQYIYIRLNHWCSLKFHSREACSDGACLFKMRLRLDYMPTCICIQFQLVTSMNNFAPSIYLAPTTGGKKRENEKRSKKRLFSWSYSRDLAGSGEKSRITSSIGHNVVMPGLLNADAGWPEIIWRFTSFLTWNAFYTRLSDILFLSGTRRLLTFSTGKGRRRNVGGKTGETCLLPLLFF